MFLNSLSPDTLLRKARILARTLWVRVVAMGFLAVIVLALARGVEPFLPRDLDLQIGGQAADRLLQIIANAMLVVTTFSLSVMVALYRSSSTQWTPRVHRLISQDPVTQNTLAAFIGAYVYALTAIVLRELRVYDDSHALVLFVATVLVLAFVVWSLIRWVLHLQTFGSLIETTRQLERITLEQFRERVEIPCLGARPWTGPAPADAQPIPSPQSGYIRQIYPEALEHAAQEHGVTIWLGHGVGSYVFEGEPLVLIVGDARPRNGDDRDRMHGALLDCIALGDARIYEQDPRLGLLAMGEIATKALSPGINDPGTAIDVITRLGRILGACRDERAGAASPRYPRLNVRPLDPADLLEDAFGALGRSGAAVPEVQVSLQACYTALLRHPDAALARAALAAAASQYLRARNAMDFPADRDRLERATSPQVRDAADGLAGRQVSG